MDEAIISTAAKKVGKYLLEICEMCGWTRSFFVSGWARDRSCRVSGQRLVVCWPFEFEISVAERL